MSDIISRLAEKSGSRGGAKRYRVITVDNGTDIAGTGATGQFCFKMRENDQTIRKTFGNEFKGVILLARAQMIHKGKNPAWRTVEFDPATPIHIPVLPLKDGKSVTNENDKMIVVYGDRVKTPTGTVLEITTNKGKQHLKDGVYNLVLYVRAENENGEVEVFKLRFKGAGRGNWFQYMNHLGSMQLHFFQVATLLRTYIDETSNKYVVGFEPAKNEQGEIEVLDENELEDLEGDMDTVLAQSAFNKQLGGGSASPAPMLEENEPEPEEPKKEDDDVQEIRIEDIPF